MADAELGRWCRRWGVPGCCALALELALLEGAPVALLHTLGMRKRPAGWKVQRVFAAVGPSVQLNIGSGGSSIIIIIICNSITHH